MSAIPGIAHRPSVHPLRIVVKAVRLAGLVVIAMVLVPIAPLLGRRRTPAVVRWWHGRLLSVLNVDVQVRGALPDTPALIVTNHSTWLDIVVLGHIFDTAFISKAEVSRWPVIGVYARLTGTLFLARGAYKTDETRKQIQATFARGRHVLLFPEGTTSATLQPHRFHARLFSAAVDDNRPVLPVALRYSDSETPRDAHHPLVPWVDTPLWPNFAGIFCLPGLRVDLSTCPMVASAGHTRRSLAAASHAAISSAQMSLAAGATEKADRPATSEGAEATDPP